MVFLRWGRPRTQRGWLVYPTDEGKTDSEETKKVVKQILAPKMTGIQVRGLKKYENGA